MTCKQVCVSFRPPPKHFAAHVTYMFFVFIGSFNTDFEHLLLVSMNGTQMFLPHFSKLDAQPTQSSGFIIGKAHGVSDTSVVKLLKQSHQ